MFAHNLVFTNPSLDDTIARLQAFESAGADVLFAPGLPDLGAVRTVCEAVSKPVNFIVGIKGKSFSVGELAAAGVRRISLATSLYRAAMTGFLDAIREVKDTGQFQFPRPVRHNAGSEQPHADLTTERRIAATWPCHALLTDVPVMLSKTPLVGDYRPRPESSANKNLGAVKAPRHGAKKAPRRTAVLEQRSSRCQAAERGWTNAASNIATRGSRAVPAAAVARRRGEPSTLDGHDSGRPSRDADFSFVIGASSARGVNRSLSFWPPP